MSLTKARDVEVLEGEWECMDCGYIEEGASNRRPKRCPECNAPGSVFEFFEYEDEDWTEDDDLEEYEDFDDDLDDDYDYDDDEE
ncbi:MAG TPA: hypothetical protein VL334_00320 [Anaerolineae bacterium]|nr:hypothetical protein [Anaerolineae bacterium]